MADPVRRARVLSGGALEVVQVLRQRRLVELREELRADGLVKLADLVDKLTFVHDSFTFTKRGVKLRINGRVIESDKL